MKKTISIKTFLIPILALLISEYSVSQVTQQWVARYNGSGNTADIPSTMVLDNSGNIYVTGRSQLGAFNDFATVKFNSSGVLQWAAKYNGTGNVDDEARAIAVDGSGNVYVTGNSYSTAINSDFVTIKYNSNGDSVWVKKYDYFTSYDVATSIAVDNFGNVYVTGGSGSSSGDYATIKYNSNGDSLWVRRFNGPGFGEDLATSLILDDSNNVYITGVCFPGNFGTVKYNSAGVLQWSAIYNAPVAVSNGETTVISDLDQSHNIYITGRSMGSGTNYDIATVKYNSAGVQQWAARYNGTGNNLDFPYGIKADGSGNVYVTGRSDGSGTGYDFVTVKYNLSGDQQWAARYTSAGARGEYATSIDVDGTGNVYITGIMDANGTSLDFTTIKYNSNGEQLWMTRYDNGQGINGYDAACSIVLDSSGNIFVTGSSVQTGNSEDFCTVKYIQSVGIRQISSEVPEQFSLSQNYPNPFNPSTKIRFEISEPSQTKLYVYDALGSLVANIVNEKLQPGSYEVSFDANNFSSGVYFYKLESNGFVASKKMLLIK
ncbi:MAG: SBBP repeat-containing protein [Bacteroidetes bacterium]|nr:SBBP repeat-containing protein [Bacteroidota bacterium]